MSSQSRKEFIDHPQNYVIQGSSLDKTIYNLYMKYKKNTKLAVDKIINCINIPVTNRKISFLFGAGINFNIAKNGKNWDSFAEKSIIEYLKTNKKYTKSNPEIIAKYIKKLDIAKNNKVGFSFRPEDFKLEIEPLNIKENEWFIDGYNSLMKKFNNQVGIFTLNYDLVLEKVLRRNEVNFLDNYPVNISKEIIHLHGIINEKYHIPELSLSTLKNYVTYANMIEEKFIKYLCSKKNEENIEETIIIIGTLVQEEHLLRAFGKFKNKTRKNIFLIAHLPNDDVFLEKIKEIYFEIGLKVVNINTGKDYSEKDYSKDNAKKCYLDDITTKKYSEDFKIFWGYLAEKIEEGNYRGNFNKIIKRKDIIDNELYSQWKSILTKNSKKKMTLEEFFEYIKLPNPNNSILIWPIFWLEKNDKILEIGSFKKFIFEVLQKFPLYSLQMIKNESIEKKDILQILDEANKIVSEFTEFGYNHAEYEIQMFIKKNLQKISKEDLLKRNKLLQYFVENSIKQLKKVDEDIVQFILDHFSYSEIDKIRISKMMISNYPDKESFIYKLFENDFKKGKMPFPIEKPNNFEELCNFIKIAYNKINGYEILILFLFDSFKELIIKNYDQLIDLLVKEKVKVLGTDYPFELLHSLIYFVMIKSKLHKNSYLDKIRSIKCIFEEFPSGLYMLGHSDSSMPNYSTYDGLPIISKKILITSWEELEEKLKLNYINKNLLKAIINFIENKLNYKTYEKILKIEKLRNLWCYGISWKINKNCQSWEEYTKYIEISAKNKIFTNESILIDIVPPFDIHKRENDLTTFLDNNYDADKFNELLKIINIKFLQEIYSKSLLWWYKDIEIALKYYKNNKETINILNKIFKQNYSWNSNNFIAIIDENKEPKDINEVQLAIRHGKNYMPLAIEKLIDMNKENQIKDFDYFIEIFDWNIRSNSDKKKWTDDFVKLVKYIELMVDKDKVKKENTKKWVALLHLKIVFNFIINQTKKPNLKIQIIAIINALIEIKEHKKYDSNIHEILESSTQNSNKYQIFSAILKIDFKKLGPLTNEKLFEELIFCLKAINKYDFEYIKKEVMIFKENLTKEQQCNLDTIIKKEFKVK